MLTSQHIVLDYEGLSVVHLNPLIYFRLQAATKIQDAYYPELLAGALCMNTPKLFLSVWNIVS